MQHKFDQLQQRAATLDAADPLAPMRERFLLPENTVYLDGNSLGPLPANVPDRIDQLIRTEWGKGLITSWNEAGWIKLAARAARKIEPVIGAEQGSVIVADSTSINLFKALSCALTLKPERRTIVTERASFPTDLYITDGVVKLLGNHHQIAMADTPGQLLTLIDQDCAAIVLGHVNFRNGYAHDMEQLNHAARKAGALTVWDLAHTAGVMQTDVAGNGCDFAVGCGYKFLNGGPGAPAFAYAAPHLHHQLNPGLQGWFSHAEPFAFSPEYRPTNGIERLAVGTPPVLSLAALDAALDLWADIDVRSVRTKSILLTDFFIHAVDQLCEGSKLKLVTPREPASRGAQISYSMPEIGYPVMQALIAQGVIGDFRAPDIVRFGFSPLYLRFIDILHAAQTLAKILHQGSWQRFAVTPANPVT